MLLINLNLDVTGGNDLVATLFNNSNTFFTHVITPGSVALTQTRFNNTQAFFNHSLAASISLLQSARFDNSNTFFNHGLTVQIVLTLDDATITAIANAVWAQTIPLGAAPSVSYGAGVLTQDDLDVISHRVWSKTL